ncbi:hypothetical protein NDU88_005888 [Pleurodeles waltl]|uniref:Uncharacterized protein n=1 Tax=Pleurodeles waltl TaxID=8319 RepID=A0AAV7PKV0_PLEWA|nr:hypothetical protein NDU88_005888 [Pleurodeles waltl]
MMPRNKSSKGRPVTFLCSKASAGDTKSPERDPNSWMDNPAPTPISQEDLSLFLQEIRSENSFLKTDAKTWLRDLRKELSELGDRFANLERTTHARSEDQEMLWLRMAVLEDHQIELQIKQEDLENRSRHNNIRIRGVPSGMEGEEIMTFTVGLLHTIGGNMDLPPPKLDRVHTVASALSRPNAVSAILTRVHFFTKEEDIL